MNRRQFIPLLATSAALWPFVTRAEEGTTVIGCLLGGAPDSNLDVLTAFRKGLREMGYVEGANLAIEYRYAHNQFDRLPELAADLVRRQVSAIATPGSDAVTSAARAVTTTIPIIFEIGGDPVQSGFVKSLSRPGGNLTGITSLNAELSAKRLGIMHELLPRARRFVTLINPISPATRAITKLLRGAASRIGVKIEFLEVESSEEIDATFAKLAHGQADALLLNGGPPFNNRPAQIVEGARRLGLPAIYFARESVVLGGLMSYATSIDRFRQVGLYVGRVLKGERPADLPVVQPTKFEFVINLQSAKALNIDVPPSLLAQADDVLE